MITYVSSRNRKEAVTSSQAVIKGLANDGGLYTPLTLPEPIDVSSLLNLNYQQIANIVLTRMLDDYTSEDIQKCIEGAYDEKFDTKEIVPVTKLNNGYLMELYHGPTSAFKDIALTILPHLLTCAYQKDQRTDQISILTATSGDTGKAAISGFADVPNTSITVFYPEIGVSDIQKRQMQTSKGDNVEVIAVKGNFDDCQRMIKQAMSDEEVKASLHGVSISSANSINVGRLMPQIVYYFSTYVKLVQRGDLTCGDKVNFVVPTGNFGDILAGYFAKQLGLPIQKLICASNSNNVLTDFINTGTYDIHRSFTPTISPSMDILISSNLERLLFLLSDYDDQLVAQMMQQLKDKGSYTVPNEMKKRIQENFVGYWTTEEQCKETIHTLFKQENQLIDPHTAIAYHAMQQYQQATHDTTPCIVLATASPYKFGGDVYDALQGHKEEDAFVAMQKLYDLSKMPIPHGLAALKELPIRFTRTIEIKDGMHVIAQRMKEVAK